VVHPFDYTLIGLQDDTNFFAIERRLLLAFVEMHLEPPSGGFTT
jgi:hypothetical protein